MKNLSQIGLRLLVLAALAAIGSGPPVEENPDMRQIAQKHYNDGNYKDAYDGFRALALDPNDDPRQVGNDLDMATNALQNLGRVNEIDAFREQVIEVHAKNWRLLQAAANNYLNVPHYGCIVAGKFHRGQHRGGGEVVDATERDRVRALQLMVQAMPRAAVDDQRPDVGQFYLSLGRMLLNNRGYGEAWRFQYLTDLGELPDYEKGWYYGRPNPGAPVDAEGAPVFYHVPDTFEAAANDGQRWRWALAQAAEVAPNLSGTTRWEFASFLQSQFGVQTMAQYGYFFGRPATPLSKGGSGGVDESGTYALHTLGEDETIAKLATGIKRFKLPDEFNHVKHFQALAADDWSGIAEQALNTLAGIFANRRQYPKAAEYWRKSIAQFGQRNYKKQQLDQIVGNWGRFESAGVQPAGQGAGVEFRYRNGKKVAFEAREIDVAALLADVKAYLKSSPNQIDWNRINVGNIGYTIIHQNQSKYVGRRVASWELDLDPLPDHFDRRITANTPLQRAGAYFVTAKMADGNTSNIVLWVSDTVIVKKPMSGKTFYFIADSVTGRPIQKANVEFFGYRQKSVGRNKFQTLTTNFAEFSDEQGRIIEPIKEQSNQYSWLIIARTKAGRLAYLGFTGVWHATYYDQEYEATKVFAITDRPVYRPKQPVKFKFWIRHAKYDQQDASDYAGRQFAVEIKNPRGDTVIEQTFTADAFGGFDGAYELPEDAMLGVYNVHVKNMGGGTFRVEEYKKPEFEVTIEPPEKPVMLGEKITATIHAKYYFGAPVTNAKVKYKVMRTGYDQRWYPVMPWDWLYGPGYWWFAYDYEWYPGWYKWGCRRPIAWWWGHQPQPPEMVADAEVAIGPGGTVPVEIDTTLAKEIHGDEDHQYTITAEVVDQSRRTIVGTGTVMVARQPFKVFSWVDRGYYRVGDTVRASFSAHTLDHTPVQGDGKLTLLRITYDKDRKPIETAVQSWDVNTDDEGKATQQLKASEAGQYRLSYALTDAAGRTIEGGYLFTVMGQGFDGTAYRFNNIELIPENRDYAPGEKVRLQVNTDRPDSTVLLFVRPANSVYLEPQVLRLKGKSTVVEIDVVQRDMPNFFIEALTVSDAKLHTETKEVIVPPQKRVLDVAVEPSKDTYKPGEKAELKFTFTDYDGKPFVGSAVVAVYDKSVEYISGGTNVPEIKSFFWQWRRRHYPRSESNLQRYFGNLVHPRQPMNDLGVFGATVADELGERDGFQQFGRAEHSARLGQERFRGMALDAAEAPMAEAQSAAKPGEGGALGGAFADDKALHGAPPMVQPSVRTQFADTALWEAALTTDGDGVAFVEIDMPENLTTWKVRVWGMGHGTRVGQADKEVVTKKNVLVRMQAPRFFIEKDEVVLSANVHNYLQTDKQVQVALEMDGGTLTPMGELSCIVDVAAGGERRVDWRVKVAAEGEAVIRMKALTGEESDAMQMTFPVHVHGMRKTDSIAGALRPAETGGKFQITVPDQRRPEQSRLEVRYSPTLAGAMVDALPYLVSYPYGCTEQTLGRFLPTVITQRILLDMDLDLKSIRDKRANLNAQEIGDDAQRAKGWKRWEHNPVFDEEEVRRMVKEGLKALADMQLSDGGWGWFSGYGEHSYPHTTAYVVHGLQIAEQNDVALVPGLLDRGVAWLNRYQDEQIRRLQNAPTKTHPYKRYADNLDAFVYMVLVDAGVKSDEMLAFLYRDRTKLAVYSNAMFGMALHKQGDAEKLDMILRNISQYVVEDDENQTAHLALPGDNYWWYWYGSENEAMAYYLKLLVRTEPKGRRASRLVKYMLNNRKHATYWNSTRDTALCIEAMAEYLEASGESKPDMVVEVWLDGQKRKEVKITAGDLFTFDNKFVLTGDEVTSGVHTVELRKSGTGPLYYNGYLTNFTLEDYIRSAGLEVKVNRKFYKLVEVDKTIKARGARGQAVDQKVEKYRREVVPNLATLTSGDLVEIELEIDSKNDYEYLIFEDMKAAGFEPVDVRSGYTGNAMGAYVEFRDNRVSFFIRQLARGKHSVAYRLRAEIPGKFSALPTRASAMYAPELRANSDEMKVSIVD